MSAPENPGTTSPPSSGVLRTTLSVTVRPESPDLLLARTLGWPDVIPGATVVLRREGGTEISVLTNATGVATFNDLLEGNYQLTVTRAFAPADLARLTADDRDFSAWGGARGLLVGSAGGTLAIDLSAGVVRRGSLVIAELLDGGFVTFQPNGTKYNAGGYVELYNNSDTTITLDGMLIASTTGPSRDYGGTRCTITRELYDDSTGVWADIIYQFPPLGKRLRPGEMVVVATDAIDHRPFGVHDMFDLRNADFETYIGPGDVDNPSVPNLIPVGTRLKYGSYNTHGPEWLALENAFVVAMAQDVATARRKPNAADGVDRIFLPRATLLDVFSWDVADPRFPPLCAPAVGGNIDATPLVLNAWTFPGKSFQRTRQPSTSWLRRSRSSARDFQLLPASPFVTP